MRGRAFSASCTRNAEPRLAASRLDARPVFLEQLDEPAGRRDGAVACLDHAVEEERQPCFPVALFPDDLQQAVILLAVLFEVEAQVEQWLAQQAGATEEQRDQQASHAAVAVEERMDRLELHVRERGLDEHGQSSALVMQEPFEVRHGIGDGRVGRLASPRSNNDHVAHQRGPFYALRDLVDVLVGRRAPRTVRATEGPRDSSCVWTITLATWPAVADTPC